eukprot:CAMPEP_0195517060 /NCGR_PEP_ID=MMETSP0794_2-20130614/9539_1 /TAXON_ID=515487 /ORGANISM="Stephanopyxis turris, Strain CCMP 815" /LENGTH=783 /DNA_ID=CAMNT_0040645803 /DNA_START=225 /DNA_END=2577 /DNA_ORIENTATION=+
MSLFLFRSSNHVDDDDKYDGQDIVILISINHSIIEPNAMSTNRWNNNHRSFSTDSPSSSSTNNDERKYTFFRNVEITSDNIAIIRLDGPKPVNTISFAMKDEAEKLWNEEIHSNASIGAVVFLSSKGDNGFIAGADIQDIKNMENKADLVDICADGLRFFRHMKSKNVPMVCGIHGAALGGGLEWALWCDYLVASDSPKTKLGLPEVKLGLLPGFGGTQNLHPRVGMQAALDMMLTGKDIRADKARKMGLVEEVVAPASIESRCMEVAKGLADGTLKKKDKKKSWFNWIVEDTSFGRNKMWQEVAKKVHKSTHGNYPSPLAIIECVKYGLEHPGEDDKYKFEREQFAKLAQTDESAALIGIFDGMTALKKHDFGKVPHQINQVAVIGAGLMGAGIAQVTAEKGYTVLLKDRDDEAVGKGEKYITDNWEKKVKRKRMSRYQLNKNDSNLIPLSDATSSWKKHMAKTDLIIEAVFESLELKRQIIANTEAITAPHCVFATNTSAIPIADIAKGSQRPENIIGMHYFSPVPSMPLLEIIPHEGTSDVAKAVASDVGTKQGKTCIMVKDVPGFYVNRCLGPFLIEVSALVRDGASLSSLDDAMKKFGMPVGPITLADEVGIDVTSKVASFLSQADLGTRMSGGDITFMEQMVEKGWLGKKTNQGFYTYKGKKKTINNEIQEYVKGFVKEDLNVTEEEIQNRIVCRFVNEAAKCLEDEIIASPTVGDIGLVFGTGFAPFRGGPFRYLDSFGVDKYVGMMNGFADRYGAQFEPCDLLKDYAAEGKKFHS